MNQKTAVKRTQDQEIRRSKDVKTGTLTCPVAPSHTPDMSSKQKRHSRGSSLILFLWAGILLPCCSAKKGTVSERNRTGQRAGPAGDRGDGESRDHGKTVLGHGWPLVEKAVDKETFTRAYIEAGGPSGKRVGILMGRNEKQYYFAWYLLFEKRVKLLKCGVEELGAAFPSDDVENEMKKRRPARPVQTPGLRNIHLERLMSQRQVRRISIP